MLLQLSRLAKTPGPQTGGITFCPPKATKLGIPKVKAPNKPVSTTLLPAGISYLPPKSNREAGHITGSQTLNNILQSLALITSIHSTLLISSRVFSLAQVKTTPPMLFLSPSLQKA